MESSMPKFENKEALEQYLENLKLQLLNSEFAALGKNPQEAALPVQNSKLFLNQNNGPYMDINQEILLQSNIKQEENQQAQNQEEPQTESIIYEETRTNSQNFVHSFTQTNYEQDLNNTAESHIDKTFSEKHESQASFEQIPNGSGRPRLIQPIYFVCSNEQVGYVEVDLNDENAMRNIFELLPK